MIIDALPLWLLFLLTVAIVLLAVEIGVRLGKLVRRRTDEERESPVSTIVGAILGLLAFMLAFTFGIVSQRYDARKGLVRDEANVLRTVWHRSDFLQEPDRSRIVALLRDYVDDRVRIGQSADNEEAVSAARNAIKMQRQIWDITVANAKADPFMNSDIGALYVESVNQIADFHALRVTLALQARIPSDIWIMLYILLFIAMIGVGYQTAIADSRRSRASSLLSVSFSLVIALIAALDNPMTGFVRVSASPLVSVQTEMKNASTK